MKTPRKARFYGLAPNQIYKATKHFARANRKDPTAAEDLLWTLLGNRQVDDFKFRRQHPIGSYIVDFVCFSAKLIVEVDGEIHEQGNCPKCDARRTRDLFGFGFDLIRFTNDQVLNASNKVIEDIRDYLRFKEKNSTI
jgi:very-short-patch-repair endonuclease